MASLERELREQHHKSEGLNFLLGYSYYLKAVAENIFLQARRQGIVLTEDFAGAEANTFNEQYFQQKSAKSLGKAQQKLKDYP